MPNSLIPLIILAIWLPMAGCSNDPGSGPLPVKWDRFTCERCRMVLSDQKHAAQVRYRAAEGGSQVRFFDDLGCAVLWLEDKPWGAAPDTEIWVTDWRDGAWIDARRAHYLPGQVTPMAFGLGAQADPAPNALTFAQASQHILDKERHLHQSGRSHGPPDPAGHDPAGPTHRQGDTAQ